MTIHSFKKILISCLVVSSFTVVANDHKVELDFIGNYAQTDNPIQANGKTFTFKTGSIGLRGIMNTDKYGKFFLQYGVAYSPSESANFLDAKLSGSIDVKSIGYGYIYPYDIVNTPWSIDFKFDKATNKHTGDNFSGTYNGNTATASVNATSEFMHAGLGLNYQLEKDVILTIGAGSHSWDIEAEAKGKYDILGIGTLADFTADLKKNGTSPSGTDNFYFVESVFPLMDREVKVGFRRSGLNTDTDNTLNEIYVNLLTTLK
jgi:hypothetical protein